MSGSTLSHGVYKPATPDTGDVWFPAMANNMQILNDHTHNGTDANLIATNSLSVLAANWGSPTNGTYTQTITLPIINTVQIQYDAIVMLVKLSTGEVIYPPIVRLSATTFSISTIDNTQTYTILFR